MTHLQIIDDLLEQGWKDIGAKTPECGDEVLVIKPNVCSAGIVENVTAFNFSVNGIRHNPVYENVAYEPRIYWCLVAPTVYLPGTIARIGDEKFVVHELAESINGEEIREPVWYAIHSERVIMMGEEGEDFELIFEPGFNDYKSVERLSYENEALRDEIDNLKNQAARNGGF